MKIVSTPTGEEIAGTSLGPEYWVKNLRAPVRFLEATRTLLELGHDTFVELSPHPVLSPALDETRRALGYEALVTGSLRRGEGERRPLLAARLGGSTSAAIRVQFDALHPEGGQVPPGCRRHPCSGSATRSRRAPAESPAIAALQGAWVLRIRSTRLLGIHMQSSVEEVDVHFWETEVDAGAPLDCYTRMAQRAAAEVWVTARTRSRTSILASPIPRPKRPAGRVPIGGREQIQLVWMEASPGHARFRVAGSVRGLRGRGGRAPSGGARRGAHAPLHEIRWERAEDPISPRGRGVGAMAALLRRARSGRAARAPPRGGAARPARWSPPTIRAWPPIPRRCAPSSALFSERLGRPLAPSGWCTSPPSTRPSPGHPATTARRAARRRRAPGSCTWRRPSSARRGTSLRASGW